MTLCVHQGQHCQKDDMSAEGHDHFLLHQLQWVHYHPKRFHIKLILCESDRLIFNSWLEHLVLLRSWVQIHHGQSGQFCNFVLYLILTTCHCHATHICLCWLSFQNVSIKPPHKTIYFHTLYLAGNHANFIWHCLYKDLKVFLGTFHRSGISHYFTMWQSGPGYGVE